MRDFWDIRFGRRERKDEIDPAAYSRDGYLIHQGRLAGVSYGRRTSRESGCGWIACFNFLRFMNTPEPAEEVARRMEHMLLWGGLLGSHPLAVWWYLHRRGYRFRVAFLRRGSERILRRTKGRTAGVIAYWHGKGAHFAAFVREETAGSDEAGAEENQSKEGKQQAQTVRFLNAVYGIENHRLTMGEFFKRYVKFPLAIVLVAR